MEQHPTREGLERWGLSSGNKMVVSLVVLTVGSPASCFQHTSRAPYPTRPLTRRLCSQMMSGDTGNKTPTTAKKKAVVVGGGWAGFGAAKALTESGIYDVTLLDANPNLGGLSAGWRTPGGRAVEAGIKGFWWSYPNIYNLVQNELGLDNVFTDWTGSSFYSPEGLQVEAPVLHRLPPFPAPLGMFRHTFNLFTSLPVADRLSMMPLLYAVIDHTRDERTYAAYDSMTARELFRRGGVSKRLYEEFLKPILLVGLFAPPEELSAGVVLGMLYFYVLAHQPDFDVRWCRGSVTEKLFAPMVNHIKENEGKIKGGMLVSDLELDGEGRVKAVLARDREGEVSTFEADAVVLCVSIQGMKKLLTSSPSLGKARPDLRRAMSLRSVDVMATRLWFDKKVEMKNPSNVIAGFEDGVGGTFFHLNDLQDEYKDSHGSVIASDYYHASELLPLTDEQIVERVHKVYLSTCLPAFRDCKVIDSWVGRFPQAVTCFSPGSLPNRPKQSSPGSNVFVAGDWVKGVDHGANGLSQERAYVTGLIAANNVIDDLPQESHERLTAKRAEILQTEPDEPQVMIGKRVNRAVGGTLRSLGLPDPLLDFTVFPKFFP